jgi:hypothetical protein
VCVHADATHLRAAAPPATAQPRARRLTVAPRVQALLFCALVYCHWYVPVDYVPKGIVAPMFSRPSFPWSYAGTEFAPGQEMAAVSMMGWVFLCDRFAGGAESAVDSLLTF